MEEIHKSIELFRKCSGVDKEIKDIFIKHGLSNEERAFVLMILLEEIGRLEEEGKNGK